MNDEVITKKPHYIKNFDCPICQRIMVDPVIATDGFSYDRLCIEQRFMSGIITSPKTNAALKSKNLIHNHQLRATIEPYLSTNDLERRQQHQLALNNLEKSK